MFQDHYRKVKRQFKKTAKGAISDHRIGISFAIGTFVALLPFSIFALAIGLALIAFFKYIHKLSLFLALLFWNGFWNAILLVPAIKIGYFFIGDTTPFAAIPYVGAILTGTQYYIVGISVIAVYTGALSYFVIRLLVKLYRLRLERRAALEKRLR